MDLDGIKGLDLLRLFPRDCAPPDEWSGVASVCSIIQRSVERAVHSRRDLDPVGQVPFLTRRLLAQPQLPSSGHGFLPILP